MTPKNRAAVELGRRGGKARAQRLTAEERSEAARKAVEARWAKQKERIEEAHKLIKETNKRLKKLLRTQEARRSELEERARKKASS